MKKIHIILLSIVMAIASCQKKDSTTATPADATITISSPVAAQLFRKGDTVHINAKVTYPTELHGYELTIADSGTSEIYFDYAEHVHNDHFDIIQTWTCTDTVTRTLALKLTTEIDHSGGEASTTVYFKYKP